jgi:NAD(P)H-dependent FMN reductase
MNRTLLVPSASAVKVAVVASSPSERSRSRAGARHAAAFLRDHGISAELIDLRRTPLPLYDPGAPADPRRDELVRLFNEADAWVLSAPVYNWGTCSHLTNFLHYALDHDGRRYRPFVLVAGAGSLQSLLALDGTGRTLLHEVYGVQVGPPVLLAADAVDRETDSLGADARPRLECALAALIHFAAASARLAAPVEESTPALLVPAGA